MVRIVGNRGAALQQLQTRVENRARPCIENVVRLEVVIVSCSVMVRQSIWPLASAVCSSESYADRWGPETASGSKRPVHREVTPRGQ